MKAKGIALVEIYPDWFVEVLKLQDRDAYVVITPHGVETMLTTEMLLTGQDRITKTLRAALAKELDPDYLPPPAADCWARIDLRQEAAV